MKNFKKVISVVIALALVISSFTAVSASKFADVAETASYAEAVGALAALGVANGTEENGAWVFKPESQVTRAEAATMIVGALNMTNDAKASAATSQFADVNTQAAWAAGYVNVGVAQGFIKGYDASTFGPLDNVTYAQLCVMLTSITGYDELAASRGGWPTGYTTTAAQAGMSKGVSAAADTALTKGEVAIMIYNALQVPMLGVSQFNMLANSFEPLDGKNDREFKTLLSDKFGGYVAEITITGTPANEGTFDQEEVFFTVRRADYWENFEDDGDHSVSPSDDVTNEESKFSIDVNALHNQTGNALFVTNEDGDLELIYFAGADGSKTKSYDAAEYVYQDDVPNSYKYTETNKRIKFGSQYVKLNADRIEVYVNGYGPSDIFGEDADDFEALMQQAAGEVRITETKDGDDKVQSIYLTCYELAKVLAVEVDDDETVISLEDLVFDTDIEAIKIDADDVEDGLVTVTVKKNGAVADVADLKKGDVVAFATHYGALVDDAIEVSGPIEILATDDTVSGVVKSVDEDEATYSIDGTDYYVLGLEDHITAGVGDAEDAGYVRNVVEIVKKTIKAELDPFGRIFAKEISATDDKYAIVLRYEEDDDLVLLLADGTKKIFDASDLEDLDSDDKAILVGADAAGDDYATRVIKYTVKARTGAVSSVELAAVTEFEDGEYNAKSKKLAGNRVTEGTLIINAQAAVDASDYDDAADYEAYSADALAAKVPYTGYAFDRDSDSTPFIVLTSVDVVFGEDARFAVVVKVNKNATTEDGDDIDEVIALYEGKEDTLIFANNKADNLSSGDVILFEQPTDGEIKKVYKVFDESENEFYAFDNVPADKYNSEDWSFSLIDDKADMKLVRGVLFAADEAEFTFADYITDENGDLVLKVINANIELGDEEEDIVLAEVADDEPADDEPADDEPADDEPADDEPADDEPADDEPADDEPADDEVNYNDDAFGVVSYSLAENLKPYVYNPYYSGSNKIADKFKAKSVGQIKNPNIARFEQDNDDLYVGDMERYAVQAIALIVDGDIVDIFLIESEK